MSRFNGVDSPDTLYSNHRCLSQAFHATSDSHGDVSDVVTIVISWAGQVEQEARSKRFIRGTTSVRSGPDLVSDSSTTGATCQVLNHLFGSRHWALLANN